MAHCKFSYRFSFGFGLMATCFHGKLQRDSPRGDSHIGAQARANASRLLIGLGLYGMVAAAVILTLL
jgi:hypothetical protein